MATVSIQDIESVDDYWGPTFRAILEGNATDQISEQIESRIKAHDKEIEKICNLYYQVLRLTNISNTPNFPFNLCNSSPNPGFHRLNPRTTPCSHPDKELEPGGRLPGRQSSQCLR